MNDLITSRIGSAYPDAIESSTVYAGEFTLVIRKSRIREVCTLLRDELQFDSLRDAPIGILVMLSTPPAMTTSMSPLKMACAAK